MRHLPTIIRQVRRSFRQAGLFVLCVALSLTTLTAFSGFSKSVHRALQKDARTLHAADIIIRSHDPISAPVTRAIQKLEHEGRIVQAKIHEFYSVVRAADKEASALSRLKVVQPGYPFYGQVTVKSGRPFKQVLTAGVCVVEQTLLDRLSIAVGDRLKVGYATLTISDVVTVESDRPLDLFAFGPRIFIAHADLENLGLLTTGSHIHRIVLLKVLDSLQVDAIAAQLEKTSPVAGEHVDTYLTARSVVTRFLDNLLFFLKLVGLFILMIAGLGIQSTLMALFNEKQRTIAVMKTMGATGRFITVHFMLMVVLLGAVGTGLGILAGACIQEILARMLAPMLPQRLDLAVSWGGVAEAVVMGLCVVALFSFLPLYRLRQMRPVAIFNRQPSVGVKRWPYYVTGLLMLIFFIGLVLWHMRDVRFGLYFVGTICALILTAALLAQLVLWTIKRLPIGHLALRQAIKGLFRRGNATRAIMITLTASLAVIFCDHLIENNLTATFVHAYPADSPNAFFMDIQPDQTEGFTAVIGRPVQFYPVVRARITAVNDIAIDHDRERQKRRDNLSRVFNLTYRQGLLDDERLIQGDTLFRSDWAEPQVSIMDTIVDMHDMKIGDRIRFNIQGVPLTARISSIRTRENESLSPFFYFVFPDAVLAQAPQTVFAAIRVPSDQIGPLQTKVVARFPNISAIDMSQTIGTLAGLMMRLSSIVRVFSAFSIAAGILILVSAVVATRAERVMESVYYKILGAGKRFVFTVFALENMLVGALSSLLAMTMAQVAAYWVCAVKFDIDYQPFWSISLVMIGLTVMLVISVGMAASRSIMAKKPVSYLREHHHG